MITGFNTDVEHEGRTYHVQTEDKGRDNPVVESLIYCQGEILGTRQTEYADRIEGGYDEARVAPLLERQHHRIIREIRNGLWSPEGPRKVGEGLLTDSSFDDLVAEFLQTDNELEWVHLFVEGEEEIVEGQKARLSVRALVRGDEKTPAPSTFVAVRLVQAGAGPVILAEGETDEAGLFECRPELPSGTGGNAALILSTPAAGGGQLRLPVRKPS